MKGFLAMILMFAMAAALVQGQGTRVGFYKRTCPRAESIVRSTVQSHFRSNPAIAPGLLRMHFHDCFVQGCDASILIDGADTEKTAPPNLLLRGYDVIDDAKTQLETACPGVVSCADILALAARDSVVLTRGINWQVPTGRRDGRVSLASDTSNLPGFRESIDSQKQKFSNFGLNTQDLVALVGKPFYLALCFTSMFKGFYPVNIPLVLSLSILFFPLTAGGHTIGTSACQFFSYRLYNFTNGGPDPTINPAFVPQLQALCPQKGDGSRRIDLDTGSGNRFDASFFTNLRNGRGILESDQKLWTDASTRAFVQRFLGARGLPPLNFNVEFARSMVKMSNIGVKTGTNGEIRRICSAVN
ncbi:peroxidase N1-like isoform X1 [Durio zibethinus]|uniref:Peroxidase n=1 Tax=Durio zibethinus TaxID=66656 RepID=A0A6P6AC17_DURZI|nr:peroxidase N1-like isoform X1 [Durio zibethinus]